MRRRQSRPAVPAPEPPADHGVPSWLGLVAIAGAALLWAAAAAVAVELFDAGVTPFELSEARAVIAAIGLAVVGGARAAPTGAGLPVRFLIALGLSIAFVNATYYSAIDRLDVAVAIVLQYTAPALVVTYVALVARRSPPPEVVVACAVALAGVVFASELPAGDIGDVDLLGVGFGLASAVFFSTYTLLGERASRTYGTVRALFRAFAVSSLFWIVVQIPQGWPDALFAGDNVLLVLFVGVFGTLTPFLLYVWGIKHVAAARAAITATLEPPFAAIVAWIWLNQSLSPLQVAGGALILGAVVSLHTGRARRAAASAAGALRPDVRSPEGDVARSTFTGAALERRGEADCGADQ